VLYSIKSTMASGTDYIAASWERIGSIGLRCGSCTGTRRSSMRSLDIQKWYVGASEPLKAIWEVQ
jgi:hypothetical protein